MKVRVLPILVALASPSMADPTFRLADPATIEVCWPGECGVQYGLYGSTDLESWDLVGGRILGLDGTMSAQDDITGAPEKFYRVEEFSDFVLDLLRFKFSTIGNKWVYEVVDDNVLGFDFYTWETEIIQRTEFNGEAVVEWIFNRDGFWDRSIYLRDDFSTGIYEVGGVAPGTAPQINTPPAPSLLASFSPGVAAPITYNSGVDVVTEDMIITIEKDPVVVAAGTFTGVIKVVHEYVRTLMGFQVIGTTTEWFALDVGMLKHVGEFEVLGSTAITTFELLSYEVN